jgi:two-component system OmpR family response regulator
MLQNLDIAFARLMTVKLEGRKTKVSLIYTAIVEGNPHLRSLLGWHLQQAGYTPQQCANLQQARSVFARRQPTLVILDADLAEGDAMELCKWLHQQRQSMILILSARNTEKDIVRGLNAGADDYLTKPFGMQEFMARVEALIRRVRVASAPLFLDYGDLKIDLVQRRVQFRGDFMDLTPQEFSLLYVLAQAEGNALSRSELLQKAWPEAIDNPRTIDTHVLSLRKKIETDPRQPSLIQTVRNVGYRFNPEVIQEPSHSPVTSSTTQVAKVAAVEPIPFKYVFGFSNNAVLKRKINYLLDLARLQYFRTQKKARLFDDVYYAAKSWDKPRRIVMKAEWLEKGGNPRFLVTNLETEAQELSDNFYVQRGASSEHRIKELKLGINADRLSCHKFIVNQFRLFLCQAAYILMLELRASAKGTSLAIAQVSRLRETIIKIARLLVFLLEEL